MPFELVPSGTHFDFIGKWRIAVAFSLALILASLIAVPIRGIRLGIDFAGGNEMIVQFEPGVPAEEGAIRGAVASVEGVEEPSVIRFGEVADREFVIRFRGEAEPAIAPEAEPSEAEAGGAAGDEAGRGAVSDRFAQIESALREQVGAVTVQRVEFVGPTVGEELQTDGMLSIFWASLAILAYIAFRFSSRYAPGAVVALIHDIAITCGAFVMLGLEFDLSVLAALLAILGYSLNDTIIIYDRIRENLELHTKAQLPEILNMSINQTLSRTLLTSGTTLIAVVILFALGGDVIRPFALAMLIGIVIGTYSSIYIAAPIVMWLERRAAAR